MQHTEYKKQKIESNRTFKFILYENIV